MGVSQGNGTIVPPTEQNISDEMDIQVNKYLRGEQLNLESVKDKKLKGELITREALNKNSAQAAVKHDKWFQPNQKGFLEAEGVEKIWRLKQQAIFQEVDISSSRNQYDIVVPDLGPYRLDITTNGRYMMVGGRKGHLAIVDKNMNLIKEFQVRETVRDVVFLHDQTMFAAAQKKYPYIYNRDGTELHCLQDHAKHGAALRLQYLEKHGLLASISEFGQLHYQDVTHGQMLCSFRTGFGRTQVMQVNRHNGIIALGHSGGKVTMWTPNKSSAEIEILCHQGPISALAFHHTNRDIMATAGKEKKIKIWDMRNLGRPLQTLPGQAETLNFSQEGLLARGLGSFVQVLRDSSGSHNYEKYMTHQLVKGYQIEKVLFRSYEDALCIGHSMGFSSILIPGSGNPNYDTYVADPYETPKQRREREVHALLDKLPPETIMWDPTKIGTLRPPRKEKPPTKEEKEAEIEAAVEVAKDIVPKKKTKGRSKPSKLKKKKQEIIANAKRPFKEQQMKEEEQEARKRQKLSEQVELPTSLQRFAPKKAAT